MIIIGILLSIAGLGFFCWALVYARRLCAAILCRRVGRNVRL